LVDIDVKGAIAIQDAYPDASLSIFIQAPSIDVLRDRLYKRGTETVSSLEERVSKAVFELSFATQFDSIIVNDDLNTASTELIETVEQFLKS
jgi:guanylate kinase